MKKLLNVIKKIICVFGGIILILVIQASISSILRLINPTEEDPEEKKELEVEAVYTGGGTFSLNTEEERLKGKKFYPTIQEAVAGSAIGNEQGEEYQRGIDHVIATFENSNYVIMLCQSCKGNSEVCRAWVKLKKEKIDGKDQYAFLGNTSDDNVKKRADNKAE
ncbi:MAG: hypothetical protein ACLTBD_02545 [Clostridia bacterium]